MMRIYITTVAAVIVVMVLMTWIITSMNNIVVKGKADKAVIAACVHDGKRVEDCRALLYGGYLEELRGEE